MVSKDILHKNVNDLPCAYGLIWKFSVQKYCIFLKMTNKWYKFKDGEKGNHVYLTQKPTNAIKFLLKGVVLALESYGSFPLFLGCF